MTRRMWASFLLAAGAIPTPLASIYITLSDSFRSDLGANGTTAIFTAVVAGTFSIVLIASLLINAVIIAIKLLRRASWHVSQPFIATQVALLLTIAGWQVSLASAYDAPESDTATLTLLAAAAITVLSISIFAIAVLPSIDKQRTVTAAWPGDAASGESRTL